MTALRSGFSDLLAPGFRKMYHDKFGMYPEEFSKVFDTSGSVRQYEDESEFSGLGSMPAKEEGVAISFDEAYQGYDKRYTHTTYALGFRVSEELWEDDLYGIMNRMPKSLATSGKQTKEVVNANHVNNGFSDTYTGPDSEPLFGDATTKLHPRLDGGTWRNQLATAADLSVTSLEALIQVLEETVDDRGLLVMLKAIKLIVPGELKWNARELLDSMDKPYTSNNEINPLRDEGLKYVVWHYLTDADAFFLQAEGHYMKHLDRIKPQFKNDDDFHTGDALFKARLRFSSGWSGARGMAGSPGA